MYLWLNGWQKPFKWVNIDLAHSFRRNNPWSLAYKPLERALWCWEHIAGEWQTGSGERERRKREGQISAKQFTLRGTHAWARALSLNFSNLHKKSPVGDHAVSTVSLRRIFHNNPHIRSEIWGMETKCHWQGDKYMCLYLTHGQPRVWRKAGM